ncbi:hypothetical protein KCV87_03185 [Actinosynnema pretiosum subsp. pretiosum]|uniref:Fibronectin type III domain protein n=2 Tax=Actinosynnema TaxID=40566 RepID=C6W9R1_ACTMD|nr:DUF6801 domain-containing protein [Actinosynnema mirum]ACU37278.1 Fibronectin type III domain protein [Actinosynnema mirum DSM 43827]AXX30747.1 hypothetical protein APASM_3382 [Actinosynnema pretiosum subsp. pretiosum]QUF05136.1 hypothetical protein KCV87_03185 [Actinosynnema pretiosum subsp. pretiosum]
MTRAPAAAVVALLLTGALAGTASAAPAHLVTSYTCATSTGESVPVGVHFGGFLPDDVGALPNAVSYAQSAFVDLDLDITNLVDGRVDGDSTAEVRVSVTGPAAKQVTARLAFAPGQGWSWLHAAGGLTPLLLSPAGDYEVRLGDIALSLRPKADDGTPLPPLDALCTRDPGGGDLLGVIKSLAYVADRPLRPTSLTVTATTPTTATLTWEARSWWEPTADYDVHLDGARVATTTDRQVTLTGLTPDSQHRVKVLTRDVRGSTSLLSQGLVFATARG